MTTSQPLLRAAFGELVETALRLALVAVLVVWCYQIIAPFLDLLIWAVVLAIAGSRHLSHRDARIHRSAGIARPASSWRNFYHA